MFVFRVMECLYNNLYINLKQVCKLNEYYITYKCTFCAVFGSFDCYFTFFLILSE